MLLSIKTRCTATCVLNQICVSSPLRFIGSNTSIVAYDVWAGQRVQSVLVVGGERLVQGYHHSGPGVCCAGSGAGLVPSLRQTAHTVHLHASDAPRRRTVPTHNMWTRRGWHRRPHRQHRATQPVGHSGADSAIIVDRAGQARCHSSVIPSIAANRSRMLYKPPRVNVGAPFD